MQFDYDIEYEYASPDDPSVQLENLFYSADYQAADDPRKALELLQEFFELSVDNPNQFLLQAHLKRIKILIRLEEWRDLNSAIVKLLKQLGQTSNYKAQKCLKELLQLFAKCKGRTETRQSELALQETLKTQKHFNLYSDFLLGEAHKDQFRQELKALYSKLSPSQQLKFLQIQSSLRQLKGNELRQAQKLIKTQVISCPHLKAAVGNSCIQQSLYLQAFDLFRKSFQQSLQKDQVSAETRLIIAAGCSLLTAEKPDPFESPQSKVIGSRARVKEMMNLFQSVKGQDYQPSQANLQCLNSLPEKLKISIKKHVRQQSIQRILSLYKKLDFNDLSRMIGLDIHDCFVLASDLALRDKTIAFRKEKSLFEIIKS